MADTPSAGSTWHLRDEKDGLYYGKCRSDEVPHTVTNEWVCARLARAAGLPSPPCALRQIEDEWFFVTEHVDLPVATDLGFVYLHSERFLHDFAHMLVFDQWVMNRDRWPANYFIRTEEHPGERGPTDYRVVVFDHDRALFAEKLNADGLRVRDRYEQPIAHVHPQIVRVFFRSRGVTLKRSSVEEQIATVESIPDSAIAGALERLPTEVLGHEDRAATLEVLAGRRDRIGAIVYALMRDHSVSDAFV